LVPAYANPGKAAEGGTNALPGQAVGKCENTSLGTVLEVRCVTGTAADGFAQVNEHVAELVAAAEGDVWAGESTVEQMRMLMGAWRCRALPPSQ